MYVLRGWRSPFALRRKRQENHNYQIKNGEGHELVEVDVVVLKPTNDAQSEGEMTGFLRRCLALCRLQINKREVREERYHQPIRSTSDELRLQSPDAHISSFDTAEKLQRSKRS